MCTLLVLHPEWCICKSMSNKWTIEYYSEKVQDEILNLPVSLRSKYFQYTDRIEIFGPNLGMPYTRSFGEGLFELRMKGPDGIARAFFCTKIGKKVVILHSFVKKTQKTPAKDLKIATKRHKEIKNANP